MSETFFELDRINNLLDIFSKNEYGDISKTSIHLLDVYIDIDDNDKDIYISGIENKDELEKLNCYHLREVLISSIFLYNNNNIEMLRDIYENYYFINIDNLNNDLNDALELYLHIS